VWAILLPNVIIKAVAVFVEMKAKIIPIITPDVEDKFWKTISISDNPNLCWETKVNKTNAGYGMFKIGTERFLCHRISYTIHFGEIPKGMHVLHRCDNPPCCNPNHLFIGDDQANNDDMRAKGRGNLGEKNGMNKISAENAYKIRLLGRAGANKRELAKFFGVAYTTVKSIINGNRWKQFNHTASSSSEHS
jgi:hypothetical protein